MPKLIVAILTNLQVCHDVLQLWDELNVPGATILDSMGRRNLEERQAHRDDLPLMPSLRSVLEQEEFNHRTLFSVVADDFDVDELIHRTEELVGDFEAPHTGLLFVAPLLQVRGLRRKPDTVP
jgi:nitrogen regulatory protein PII